MKFKLFMFAMLAVVGFFNPRQVLSPQVIKAIYYLAIFASGMYAFYAGGKLTRVDYPRSLWWVLLGGMAVSVFMPPVFQSQSLIATAMATLPFILTYSYFLILMKLEVEPEKIIRLMFVLCSVAVFVYFVNLSTFPNCFFGEKVEEDLSRGILRLPITYIHVMVLLIFYSINRWNLKREKKWIFWMALFMMMVFLSVTRQYILSVAALSVFFLLSRVSMAKKIVMTVAIAGVCAYVVPKIPVYSAMMDMAERVQKKQEDRGQDDIRIEAYRYYVVENQASPVTAVLGNGMPAYGASRWGKMFDSETEESGLFAFDIGWAGFYYFFGIFSTVALMLILAKAFFKKKREDQKYLTYWICYTSVISFTSGPILYYWEVFNVVTVLYLIYSPCNSRVTAVADNTPELLPRRCPARRRFF